MERNSAIPIRNIYYMLSYAYQALNLSEYQHMGTEQFENIKDLYAEILSIGIPVLIRGGLSKDYVSVEERSTVIKGKIDINSTIKTNALVNKKLMVIYEEFSEDILLNQIMKATLVILSRSAIINQKYRRICYGFLPFFTGVSDIELSLQVWKRVRYNRQNIRYPFIIDVCRYLFEELLLHENLADQSRKGVQDEQRLSSLYEKFIFSFYKRETDYLVSRPQIQWSVDDGFTDALPIMQTDIVLQRGNKTLIVDAKFYSENMAVRFEGGASKQKSGNLYQIFTYITNWERKPAEIVGGMLLYARTTALHQPIHKYKMNGNEISIVTLDLNQDFNGIKGDLLAYADQYFE
ncbi:restriction endonuclease [Paenibacillus sp. HB172176]|uniref:5-methylcytosine restriction system specificity protein McrC n=1 Tax=Paenibacillus sp. HB172176 TaxID=2493690 RepID=UPI00143C9A40|nr:restriction endonuclease [Paenibacillus sp. HB172176]